MIRKQLFAAASFNMAGAQIDRENGVIRGIALNQVGPAKGHGVQLDQSFVNDVVRLGNEQGRAGLKVRYGHPTMCGNALLDAPFIGRVKNLYTDGETARGDLFLSNSAMETPAGDLYERVLAMAEEDADMFGMSIVFMPGLSYRVDKDGERYEEGTPEFSQLTGEPFATIEKLYGVDVVDEGAATDGLFGIKSAEFATVATEFLDNNERLWALIDENPQVVEQFMARYKARYERNNNEEISMLDNESVEAEEVAEEVTELSAESEEVTELETAEEQTETFAAEPVEVVEVAEQPVSFKELYDQYGAAFAEYAFEEKLTANEAKDAYLAHLQDRVADLEMQLAEAHDDMGEEPVEFAAVVEEVDADKARANARATELKNAGVSAGVASFAASLNLD